jgi:hypothetical protein
MGHLVPWRHRHERSDAANESLGAEAKVDQSMALALSSSSCTRAPWRSGFARAGDVAEGEFFTEASRTK